jgi:hypothetical protein
MSLRESYLEIVPLDSEVGTYAIHVTLVGEGWGYLINLNCCHLKKCEAYIAGL